MSQRRRHRSAAQAASGPGRGRTVALAVVVVMAGLLAARSWRSESRSKAASSPAASAVPPAAPTAAPAGPGSGEQTPPRFRPLLGEWRRPDGGYVLSVQSVSPDGAATVQYFNPRPIHVARAEGKQEEGLVGLFVELDDVNYPGSNYTLGYDATRDELRGVYFQAVQQARYEVVFVRSR